MKFKKTFLILFALFFGLSNISYAKIFPINAENNAQYRNNSGVLYLQDKDYMAAIKEFKIAIAINPNHQTTATYYNNLGTAYLELGKIQYEHNLTKKGADFAAFAETSFKDAIERDCMQLSFYKNLVESFALQGKLQAKRQEYLNNTSNPFNIIVVALIDEKLGNRREMQIALDDFIASHPNLLITISLKDYLKSHE